MKKAIYLLAILATVALTSCQKNKEATIAFYTDANISQQVDIFVNGEYKTSIYASIKHTPTCEDYYVVKVKMPEGRHLVKATTAGAKVEKQVTWIAGACKINKL